MFADISVVVRVGGDENQGQSVKIRPCAGNCALWTRTDEIDLQRDSSNLLVTACFELVLRVCLYVRVTIER